MFTINMTSITMAVLTGPCLLVPLAIRIGQPTHDVAAGRARPPGPTAARCGHNGQGAEPRPGAHRHASFWPRPAHRDLPRSAAAATGSRGLLGGAAAAVLAAVLPTGAAAGVAASGWLAVTLWLWVGEARRWWLGGGSLGGLPLLVAWGWLPVAAGWFVASRAGVAPLGFGEPITVLTAAHFHVAGFGLSVLALTTARRLGPRRMSWVAWAAWGLVSAGPLCVAAGFTVDEPVLNMVGAFVVASGVLALSPCLTLAVGSAPPAARWAGRVAAVVPLVPMVLAVVYSLGPVLGTPAPSIELMVRAHGFVNALGFVGLGLAALVLAGTRERRRPIDVKEVSGVVSA